jgi:hypothetical protein
MVGLLALAHDCGCEAELAAAIDSNLAAGILPDLHRLIDRFKVSGGIIPEVAVLLPSLSAYDELAVVQRATDELCPESLS